MIYVYEKDNSFPHIVYLNLNSYGTIEMETYINPWCNENFGLYGQQWSHYPLISDSDLIPYAFKKKVDAMAFKLRWL